MCRLLFVMKPDSKLIKKCLNGKEKAHYELFKLCFPYLMSIASRYYTNQEDALTALNDAFLKILKNLAKYDPTRSWMAWMKTILVNTILNDFRDNRKHFELNKLADEEDITENTVYLSIDEINDRVDEAHLIRFVEELPDINRKVFNLHAIDGYKHREISELLEIPVGTSRWILNQARKILMQRIQDETGVGIILNEAK